jgi:alpha-galactosidase
MALYCPDALLINYSNPMAMHCLAIERSRRTFHVGLCHGVQNTAMTLRAIVGMKKAGVTAAAVDTHFKRRRDTKERVREWLEWMAMGEDSDLSYLCAGINHMAFFLKFSSGGRDLYEDIREILEMPHLRRLDPVRFDLCERLGYFMTETSGHTSEYVPYYLRSKAGIEEMALRPGSYLQACRQQDKWYHSLRNELLAGKEAVETPYTPSVEHVSRILNAMATGEPYVFNGNVHNAGGALISNLPGDACVEVPCTADRNGITPHHIGELPPACAAMIGTNINVQDLAVRGILEGDREYIKQALLLDPNTASTLAPRKIWAMADAMFEAHKEWLPQFQ